MVRIAVDVLIGRVGINRLRAAGHDVVVVAQPAEPDREWFARALDRGVEYVIAADKDLSILCYDHRIEFFEAREGDKGRITAERFIQWYAATQPEKAAVIERVPCRGETGIDSCHTAESIKAFCSPARFVPEAAERCPKCGHIRARRVR